MTTRTERARAFDRGLRLAAASDVEEREYGWALRDPLDWRDFNNLHVVRDPGALAPDRDFVVSEVELDLPGWVRTVSVLMEHHGDRATAPDPRIEETAPAALGDLRYEWVLDEAPRESIARAALSADARYCAVAAVRAWCVRERGAPVAMAWLMGDGDVQMVENVYTTPSARGRGLGAALVQRAVAESTADLVFLPTGADGQARRLYERLGFRTLCETQLFSRA